MLDALVRQGYTAMPQYLHRVRASTSDRNPHLLSLRSPQVWHPDRHGGAENAKRKFQSIQYAYEVLSNETRRAHYDLQWLDLLDVEVSNPARAGGGWSGSVALV